MAPYKIIRQGYMLKEPPRGYRKKPVRYWFVLVENKHQLAMAYFKSEDSYAQRQKNEGYFRLDDCSSIAVVGDYQGFKTAFAIQGPRLKHILVAESRYDLHEWIRTLHEALEGFKTKQNKPKEENRLRTGSQGSNVERPTPATAVQAFATPPSPMKTVDSGTGRRKPVRPAPPAPAKKTNETHALSEQQPPDTHTRGQEDRQTVTNPMGGADLPSLAFDKLTEVGAVEPPTTTANNNRPLNLSKEDRFGTLTSISQYLDLDLDVTEDEPGSSGSKTHSRSGSDALVMLHENSASFPEFPSLQADRELELSSPEGAGRQQTSPGSEGQGDNVGGGCTGPDGGSLTRGVGKEKGQKKRSSKRGGSVKVRSRSPPNLPPPPPPPLSDPLERRPSPLPVEKLQSPLLSSPLSITNLPPPPPFYPPTPSKREPSDTLPSLPTAPLPSRKMSSDLWRGGADQPNLKADDHTTCMEFTDVMNTISTIEQQLNEMECQSPIKFKESAIFRPITAGHDGNLTSPEFSDAGQDPLQRGNHYSHLNGNEDDLYDHLEGDGLAEGGGNGNGACEPQQPPPARFAASSADPPSLESKAPPVQERFDARLRSSIEVSCSDEEELFNKNLSPKKAVNKQITKRIFFPEESSPIGQAPPPPKDLIPKVENKDFPPKQSNKRNQKVVSFKAEVMDSQVRSKPAEFQGMTAPFVLQAVSTTNSTAPTVPPTVKVANIKKMLFGENELATHGCGKGGGTLEPSTETQGTAGGEGQKGNNNSNCNNLYEVPWEKKPIAKYATEFRKYENVGITERRSCREILCKPIVVHGSGINAASIIGEGEQPVQPPEATPQVSVPVERQCNGGGALPLPLSLSTISSSPSFSGLLPQAGGIAVGKVPSLPSLQGGQSDGSIQNGTLNSATCASIEAPGKISSTTASDSGGVPSQSYPRTQHTPLEQKSPKDKTGRKVEFTLPDSKVQSTNRITSFEQPMQGSYVYRSLV